MRKALFSSPESLFPYTPLFLSGESVSNTARFRSPLARSPDVYVASSSGPGGLLSLHLTFLVLGVCEHGFELGVTGGRATILNNAI